MAVRVLLIALFLCLAIPAGARGQAYPASERVVATFRNYTTHDGESLMEVARRFDVGFNRITAANPGLDPFIPGDGVAVLVPTGWIIPDSPPKKGIIINLAELRLYHFFYAGKQHLYETFPIGIGDEGSDTPLGTYRVVQKTVAPSWYVPKSIKEEKPELPDVVPPGPDNPLGSHALRLSERSILIHGTNKPWGVGRRASHGCIRLYPEDIPRLFERVKVGTGVTIVRQPVKIGVNGRQVYIEVHDDSFATVEYLDEATRLLQKYGLNGRVNMLKLLRAVRERQGYPVVISD
jgi:L,D-transpeptidase ErfK/SrfK